jgi:AcrR family transcriptional regulator
MLKPIRKLTRFVKSEAKERRRQSRAQRLISAGEKLFAAEDYDKISVADIAEAAGCSVGAFYGRFPDKESFLISVIY